MHLGPIRFIALKMVKFLAKCVVLTVTCVRLIDESTIEGKIVHIDHFCGNSKWESSIRLGDVLRFRNHVEYNFYFQIISINSNPPTDSISQIEWSGNQSIFGIQMRYKRNALKNNNRKEVDREEASRIKAAEYREAYRKRAAEYREALDLNVLNDT